jgi:hypothetical protein
MSSTTDDYVARVKQGREVISSVGEARLRDAKALLNLVPTPGNGLLHPNEVFEQNRRIAKRFVEVNAEYVKDLAGAVRKHMSGLASVLVDEAMTTAKLANEQAERVEDRAIQEAEEIVRAERAEVRRAKRAAREAAEQKYSEMTKVELADELGRRDMPKTGTVEELRERLVEAELEATS